MKFLKALGTVLVSVALILVTFFGTFKAVVFNRSFINSEMEKFSVAKDNKMTDEDLAALFDETLKYLEFKRDDLVIQTVVDGKAREAYNDQEKQHMVDCLVLFGAGFGIYHVSLTLLALGIVCFLFVKRGQKPELIKRFSGSVLVGYGVFFTVAAVLGYLFYTDFDKYFVLFHEIFFDNDLWLMDPDKCLMINLMPEDFFFDIVMKFGLIFLIISLTVMAAAVTVRIILKKKRKQAV